MKKFAVIALLLSATCGATTTKYTFSGIVDQSNWSVAPTGQTMTGSFLLNYDAPLTYQNGTAGGHYDAISGLTYQIGDIAYQQAGTWDWAVCDLPSGDILGTRDALMTDGSTASLEASGADLNQGTDLSNSTAWDTLPVKSWFLNSMQKVGETLYSFQTGGHITSVSPQLASAGVSDFSDAAPTPEPSSLILFGSALSAFLIYRRRKSR